MKLLLFITSFSLIQKSVLSQVCPVFGEELESTDASDRNRDIRFYMNFNKPALCDGTVTSWQYCYYDSVEPGIAPNNDFSARFFVYRRVSDTQHYEQVPGSALTVVLKSQEVQIAGCTTLSEIQQFQVEVNDIVGACIISNDTFNPLFLVGSINNKDLYRSGNNFCSDEEGLDSIDINTLDIRTDRTLHLSTTIESNIPCRAGNNPSSSTPDDRPSIYLNSEFPAECDGVVTAWHYCYYPEDASDSTTAYTASVAVWRYDDTTDQFILLDGSVTLLELQPVDTLAHIYCTQELLEPVNYIAIRQGDVIGVVLPTDNYIPMLGMESDNTLLTIIGDVDVSSTLNGDALRQSLALHLYAEIDPMGITTMTMGITTIGTVTGGTTDFTTQEIKVGGGTGLSDGGVAGIVIFILLLILMGVVAMVIVVYLVLRRKGKESGTLHSKPPPAPNTESHRIMNTSAMDNAIYGNDTQYYETPTESNQRYITSSAGDEGLENNYSTSTPYEPIQYQPNTVNNETELTTSDIYASVQIYEFECMDPFEQIKSEDIYAGLDPFKEPAEQEDELYSQIQTQSNVAMDIYRRNIQFVRPLGAGQFGSVDAGIWKKGCQDIPVALKTLKKGSLENDKVKFLQEAAIMAQFRHPNVVTLFGIVSEGEPIILVVELVSKGDLRKNLLEMRPEWITDKSDLIPLSSSPGELLQPDVSELLLKFSQHIALGMQYLSGKGFVHRDLAARNVLLSDDNTCKIADFGLSRDLEDENYYMSSGGMIPVKWTAPEAIHYKKYSTASDVWGYGCVLYEIWSLGHKPFENNKNVEIIRIIDSGKRLPPPPGCPRKIYHLMIKCWHPDKSDRPNFRDTILDLIEKKVDVLKIPQSDQKTHPQSGSLGAPLEAGMRMYRDLQTHYDQ